MQEQTNTRKHPPAEVRQVEARFYRFSEDEPALHVVIDGTAYRREDEQKSTLLILRECDLQAALEPLLTPEASRLVLELCDTVNDVRHIEVDQMRERLLDLIPQHKRIIEDALYPGCEPPLTLAEAQLHAACKLPVA